MSDIFLKEDLRTLFKNKKVVFLGDSNVRACYKDFLCLFWESEIVSLNQLKTKMESSVFQDSLIDHGEKINGREYKEERQLVFEDYHFEFYFITRVFNEYVKKALTKAKEGREPDVLIINSCVWDLCRWGPKGSAEFRDNLVKLMKYLKSNIHQECLVIWITTPPISTDMKGGFLVMKLEFLKYCLRFHVMEANTYCRKVVVAHGYDVVDIHYHLRMQLHQRSADGIHWQPPAVRYMTNLLLTHISLAWGVPLPHRYKSGITFRTLEESEAVGNYDDTPLSPKKNNNTPLSPKKNNNTPLSPSNNGNTPMSSEKKIAEKNQSQKPKKNGPSFHSFEKKQKGKKSHKKIKKWAVANNQNPPCFLPSGNVFTNPHPPMVPPLYHPGAQNQNWQCLNDPHPPLRPPLLHPGAQNQNWQCLNAPSLANCERPCMVNCERPGPVNCERPFPLPGQTNNTECPFNRTIPNNFRFDVQGRVGTVAYDFPAQAPSELHAMKGQNLTLIQRINFNWYEARIGDRQGIIPCSYVIFPPENQVMTLDLLLQQLLGKTDILNTGSILPFQFSFGPKTTWF